MTDGLKDAHREAIIAAIAANDRVERAVLFGSRATGTNTVTSDVDIALFGERLTLTDLARLSSVIDEIPMAQSVDLLLYDSIQDQTLRSHVRRRGAEWYARRSPDERYDSSPTHGYAGDWEFLPLGAVCTKIGSGATPRGGRDVYLPNGPYALIRSQNVLNEGFGHEGLAYIGQQHASDLAGVEVRSSDVLLNITGDSVARVCQVDPRVLPARVNQHVAIVRPDPARLDPGFLRYFLVDPTTQARLLSWAASGGTRNALTKAMIEAIDVKAPVAVSEQRAIAHVLGTLDDKIESNRRMNETLEAMARALFKSWFVDFDPVRAKMEGRDTGLPRDIADLFPDRFVDSATGQIPEGWAVGQLADAIELLSGGTPRTTVAEYWNGEIPWYTPRDAPNQSDVFVLDTQRTITQVGVDNSATKVLPSRTTVISARGTVGRLACLGRPMAMNQTCYGIRGADGYNDFFTYWLVRNAVEELRNRTHGTVFDTITRQTFAFIDTHLPPNDVAGAFEAAVKAIMERVLRNLHESRILARLRDILLPKLISGEIRVPDAERALESAI